MSDQNLQVITGVLTLITRYDVEGSKGGSVWLVVDEDEDNEDALGKGIVKFNSSYDFFDHEKAKVQANEYNLPCLVDVYYKSVMGSGNKLKPKVFSIKPHINNNKVKTEDNKPSQKVEDKKG